MNFEITGKLIEKYKTAQVTDRFRKRDFVIERRENSSFGEIIETIKFQLNQDKCEIIDNLNLGEEVKINFAIRGRRWEKDGQVNYFNNLEAWKVERLATTQAAPPPPPPTMDDIPPEPTDDLPF